MKIERQYSYKNVKKNNESKRKKDYYRNAANIIGNGYNVPIGKNKHEDYLSALEYFLYF